MMLINTLKKTPSMIVSICTGAKEVVFKPCIEKRVGPSMASLNNEKFYRVFINDDFRNSIDQTHSKPFQT